MGYEPLVNNNPLRVLKTGSENGREMGLVMARAGVALHNRLNAMPMVHMERFLIMDAPDGLSA